MLIRWAAGIMVVTLAFSLLATAGTAFRNGRGYRLHCAAGAHRGLLGYFGPIRCSRAEADDDWNDHRRATGHGRGVSTIQVIPAARQCAGGGADG